VEPLEDRGERTLDRLEDRERDHHADLLKSGKTRWSRA
jgi:hypothetical protein